MTAMYEMRGEALDYKNETSADIKAGDIVTLGSKRIAVAGSDIDKNEVGAVHVTGVFAMPKKTASDVIAMGVPLFWDATGIALAGTVEAGYAAAASKAGELTVKVKLVG
nr:MAG TPA: protein of unknown function DUF2190 [Caudoviricetes sp.]